MEAVVKEIVKDVEAGVRTRKELETCGCEKCQIALERLFGAKILVKCEECPFYAQCNTLDARHHCPQAKNFDTLMWIVLKSKDLKALKKDVHDLVKDIIKRYE